MSVYFNSCACHGVQVEVSSCLPRVGPGIWSQVLRLGGGALTSKVISPDPQLRTLTQHFSLGAESRRRGRGEIEGNESNLGSSEFIFRSDAISKNFK